jgi:hypothetical protein
MDNNFINIKYYKHYNKDIQLQLIQILLVNQYNNQLQ